MMDSNVLNGANMQRQAVQRWLIRIAPLVEQVMEYVAAKAFSAAIICQNDECLNT